MKKNMVRILAFVLVLILALGIIPMGALAEELPIDPTEPVVLEGYFDTTQPDYDDDFYIVDWKYYDFGETIKTSDYNYTRIIGNALYDFIGFVDNAKLDDEVLAFINGNISIPANLSTEAAQEWFDTWKLTFAAYVPHSHTLSYWYSDDTTHWRECLICKKFWREGFWEQFMYQNWHSDGDEDRICDVCGADIPYHEIEVIDSKGGKITVNLDEAPHRKKITATVEVEDGYKLKKLHFTKVRDDGSRQEITRYKKNGEFWTYMPTYDLEVSAEYVKKN